MENKKRKQEGNSNEEKSKKISKREKKEQIKEKKMKYKPNFLVIDEAKKYWEIFRKENSEMNIEKGRLKMNNKTIDESIIKKNEKRKVELLDTILSHLKGKIEEVSRHQDASRILQTILKYGNEKHYRNMYEELKGKVVNLSSDIYGHHIIKRLLFYGKMIRNELFLEFKGQVSKMIQERFPADVIDYAYSEIGNSSQRYSIIKEFYGKEFILELNNEQDKFTNLKEVLEKYPGKRESVLKNITISIKKSINKNLINLHIIQKVLVDCFENCTLGDIYDLILDLQDEIPHLIHTKEGVKISIYSLSYGTTSNRKKIIKSFKDLCFETSKNSFGYLFLIKCLSIVDDTQLLDSIILKEFKQHLLEMSLHPISSKLIQFLTNRLQCYTSNKLIFDEYLKKPINLNEESKKGEEKINQELLLKFKSSLIDLYNNHFNDLIKLESSCIILFNILRLFKSELDQSIMFKFISNSNLKDFQFFSRQLSKFILDDLQNDQIDFSKNLLKSITSIKQFINNQNGAFIISALVKGNSNQFRSQILKNIKVNEIKQDSSGNKLLLKILTDPK